MQIETKTNDMTRRLRRKTYIEVNLTAQDEVSFYSGFSEEIMGIFVPTFTIRPIGEPVAIKIIYDDDANQFVTLNGHIEWIREYNPMIPETYPGFGIRFDAYDARTEALLEMIVATRSSLFFESSPPQVDLHKETPNHSDNYCSNSPDHDSTFYDGLVRDILNLIESSPLDSTSALTTSPQHKDIRIVYAQVVASKTRHPNFIGGFSQEDVGHRVFVETDNMRPIGSIVDIVLMLEDGWQIRTEGLVKWRRKNNPMVSHYAAAPGLGICLPNVRSTVWNHAFPDITDPTTIIICQEQTIR